MIGEHIVLKI